MCSISSYTQLRGGDVTDERLHTDLMNPSGAVQPSHILHLLLNLFQACSSGGGLAGGSQVSPAYSTREGPICRDESLLRGIETKNSLPVTLESSRNPTSSRF